MLPTPGKTIQMWRLLSFCKSQNENQTISLVWKKERSCYGHCIVGSAVKIRCSPGSSDLRGGSWVLLIGKVGVPGSLGNIHPLPPLFQHPLTTSNTLPVRYLTLFNSFPWNQRTEMHHRWLFWQLVICKIRAKILVKQARKPRNYAS